MAFAPKEPALALAQKIHACRDCQCFWPLRTAPTADHTQSPLQPFGRFGPVPVYTAWPPHTAPAPSADTPTQVTLQAGAASPALLKGCRKAPAMLVGINPNLKNFASGLRDMPPPQAEASPSDRYQDMDDGIRTVHPAGDGVRSYMAHHRHLDTQKVLMQIKADDFEQCLDPHTTRRWLVTTTEPKPATTPTSARLALGGQRNGAERNATLSWRAEHGPVTPTPVLSSNPSWKEDESFVLLRRRAKVGQTVAGYLTPQSLRNQTVSVAYAKDGFYTHLAALAQGMGGVPGEDLGLLDMAACASARWSESAGVDKGEVIGNCVKKNNFAWAQLLQSRPRVLFFSGKEAWNMFCDALQAQAGDAAPASYLHGLDKQVYGCNEQGQTDASIFDPLGWLRQQATPGLQAKSVLRLQWQVSDPGGSGHPSAGTPPTPDIWHCRLVPMAHFSYPENVTELVHWSAQQHADFLRDFPAIARMLEAGKRLIDPRQKQSPGKPPAVFFGIFLSRPWVSEGQANPALSLHKLCEALVQNHLAPQQNAQTVEREPPVDGPALLRSVPNAQWTAAEQRIAPHKLAPLGLAARIAQQALHAEWGWDLPQPQALDPAKPTGHWPRVATDCSYCEAAGLECDYRAPALAAVGTRLTPSHPPTLDLSE